MTQMSAESLETCTNLLLKNYNMTKIGIVNCNPANIIGLQPIEYNNTPLNLPKEDTLLSETIEIPSPSITYTQKPIPHPFKEHRDSIKKQKRKLKTLKSNQSGEEPKSAKVGIMQKATSGFRNHFDLFIQNTGNIFKQAQNEMAQEDFCFSKAFKQ